MGNVLHVIFITAPISQYLAEYQKLITPNLFKTTFVSSRRNYCSWYTTYRVGQTLKMAFVKIVHYADTKALAAKKTGDWSSFGRAYTTNQVQTTLRLRAHILSP